MHGALLPVHVGAGFQISRGREAEHAEIRSAARLCRCDCLWCGDGLAHRLPFLPLSGDVLAPLALGQCDGQDTSIKLGPNRLPGHRARQPQLALKTAIAPFLTVVIALLAICSRMSLASDM